MIEIDKEKSYLQIKCPICTCNSKEILNIKTINPLSNQKVKLLECLNCFHWWHSPIPTDEYLNELYSEDNEFVTGGVLHNMCMASDKVIQRYAKPILKSIQHRELFNYLELGSGSGSLLNFFSKIAQVAIGIEPSPPKNSYNTVKNIDSLPNNISFDILVAQDVLEHLSSPIKTLKKLRNKTNKEGLLFIGVPNKDSFKARLMRGKWSMIRPFGHLHYFSSKSIGIMLENSGWKVIDIAAVRMGKLSAWE